jgi:hypothetical protein
LASAPGNVTATAWLVAVTMFETGLRLDVAPVVDRIRQTTTETTPFTFPENPAGGSIAWMIGADGCARPACHGPLSGSV